MIRPRRHLIRPCVYHSGPLGFSQLTVMTAESLAAGNGQAVLHPKLLYYHTFAFKHFKGERKRKGVTAGLTSLLHHAESGVCIKSFLCTEGMGNIMSFPFNTGLQRENESRKEIITHIIRSVWTSVSICSMSMVASFYMSCYKFCFYWE